MSQKRKDFKEYYNCRFNTVLFRWVDYRKKLFLKKMLQLEEAKKGKSLKILEVGAGTASIIRHFKQQHNIFVLDINYSLLRNARCDGLTLIVGDVDRAIPFKDMSFDILLSIDAIEHFSKRHTIIEEMSRILKKDGLMIHFTPPYDSLSWVAAERAHNALLHTTSDHVSPFTRESMLHLLMPHCKDIHLSFLNVGLTMVATGRKR